MHRKKRSQTSKDILKETGLLRADWGGSQRANKSAPNLQSMVLPNTPARQQSIDEDCQLQTGDTSDPVRLPRTKTGSLGDIQTGRPVTVVHFTHPEYVKKVAVCRYGDTIFFDFNQVCNQ